MILSLMVVMVQCATLEVHMTGSTEDHKGVTTILRSHVNVFTGTATLDSHGSHPLKAEETEDSASFLSSFLIILIHPDSG